MFKILIFLGWSIISTVHADSALQTNAIEPALEGVLRTLIDLRESVQVQNVQTAELAPEQPGEERVLVWTRLGPTYWSNNLSVVSKAGSQWRVLATRALGPSETVLASVTKAGVIVLDAKVPGPNDPICCPSRFKKFYFRYSDGQLQELTP